MSIMCRHLPDIGLADKQICQTSRIFGRPYLRNYGSQAILCQTYGLAQMKQLLDLPKFCLVYLAGPAVNDNTVFGISEC